MSLHFCPSCTTSPTHLKCARMNHTSVVDDLIYELYRPICKTCLMLDRTLYYRTSSRRWLNFAWNPIPTVTAASETGALNQKVATLLVPDQKPQSIGPPSEYIQMNHTSVVDEPAIAVAHRIGLFDDGNYAALRQRQVKLLWRSHVLHHDIQLRLTINAQQARFLCFRLAALDGVFTLKKNHPGLTPLQRPMIWYNATADVQGYHAPDRKKSWTFLDEIAGNMSNTCTFFSPNSLWASRMKNELQYE